MLKHYSSTLLRSVRDYIFKSYDDYVAALSFYLLVGLAPLLVVIVSVFSYLPIEERHAMLVFERLLINFPFQFNLVQAFITKFIRQDRMLFSAISFLITYYFATHFLVSLRHALFLVFESEELPSKSMLFRLYSLPILLMTIVGVYILGLVFLQVGIILELVHLETLSQFFTRSLDAVVNFIFVFGLYWIILYGLSPTIKRPKLTQSVVVAFALTLVFTALKIGISNLLITLYSTNPIYGVLSGIFSFLAWVYIQFVLILISARWLFHLSHSIQIPAKND